MRRLAVFGVTVMVMLVAGQAVAGSFSALQGGCGDPFDEQTSITYDPGTGELGVRAPASTNLTSINIDSAAGIFTGAPAANLGGPFDNDADNNIFKATFGDSFRSISFGPVAQKGLSVEPILRDLTVLGSLQGGGGLGDVDMAQPYCDHGGRLLLPRPVLFDFERKPASVINPTFEKEGIIVSFSADLPSVAQWVREVAEADLIGKSLMRLSSESAGGGLAEVTADFSTPLSSLQLHAKQHRGAPDAFTIEAYDATGTLLDSFTTSTDGEREFVNFSGVGPIARVRFKGRINFSLFDHMTVLPVPESSTLVLLSMGAFAITFGWRRRLR